MPILLSQIFKNTLEANLAIWIINPPISCQFVISLFYANLCFRSILCNDKSAAAERDLASEDQAHLSFLKLRFV